LFECAQPLVHLRRVQGILRLYQTRQITRLGLEHASKMGMAFNKINYEYIKATAMYFDANGARPINTKSAPIRDPDSMYLHLNQTEKKEKEIYDE